RRGHTRFKWDWSSDVCSSDLPSVCGLVYVCVWAGVCVCEVAGVCVCVGLSRAEERRGGKECRSRWWPYHFKKKETCPRGDGRCCRSGAQALRWPWVSTRA